MASKTYVATAPAKSNPKAKWCNRTGRWVKFDENSQAEILEEDLPEFADCVVKEKA